MTTTSSLWCGWIPSEPKGLCMSSFLMNSLMWSISSMCTFLLLQTFALVFLKTDLASKVWGEDTIQDHGLFNILCHWGPQPIQILLSFCFVCYILTEALLAVLVIPGLIKLHLGLVFPSCISSCWSNVSVSLPNYLALLPLSVEFIFCIWVLPGAPCSAMQAS